MIPSTPSLHAAGPLAVGALVLALAGCGSTDGGSADGDANADELPTFAAEEVLRIGSVTDPDTGFAQMGGMDVDRDGNLYVLDGQDRRIRVYSPEGTLLRFIGRRGQGPGEFERHPSFGVLGDTVWATEGSFVQRFTLFDRMGNVLSTARADAALVPLQPPQTLWGMILPRAMRPDGLFLADMTGVGGGSSVGDPPVTYRATDTIAVPRLLYDPATGDVVDTAGWLPRPPPEPTPDRQNITVGATEYGVPTASRDTPLMVHLLDGLIFVDRHRAASPADTTFRVTRTAMDGDTLWVRDIRYTPEPFPDVKLDEMAWNSARSAGGLFYRLVGGSTPPMSADSMEVFRAIRSRIEAPPFAEPVRNTYVGSDGRLWLGRGPDAEGRSRWLILEPDGSIFGEAELPADPNILWSRGDTFFLSEEDELGVPWVVKYRMTEGAGS